MKSATAQVDCYTNVDKRIVEDDLVKPTHMIFFIFTFFFLHIKWLVYIIQSFSSAIFINSNLSQPSYHYQSFLKLLLHWIQNRRNLSKALSSIIYWTWHAIVCRNKSSFGLSIILISPQGHFSFLMVIVLHYQANTYIMFLGPQLVDNLSPKFAVKMQKILFSRKQIARETIQLSMSWKH